MTRQTARQTRAAAATALILLVAALACLAVGAAPELRRQNAKRFDPEQLEDQAFAVGEAGRVVSSGSISSTSSSSSASSSSSSSSSTSGSWQRMGRFRVSDVSLLLPSEKALRLDADDLVPVSRVVSAKPGCFRWISNDERVVSITPETDARCAQKLTSGSAKIVSRHDTSNATSTVVTAIQEDATTGEELEINIEVYIAPIRGVRILTTVRRLNLYEAETLEVQAFDEEENVFSSLMGLAFQWTGVHATMADREVPLVISRLANSDVSVTDELLQESYGRFGHKIEVRGKKTGPARVTAELSHVGAGGIASRILDEVVIDVVEAMGVCPPAPILIPKASIRAVAARKVNRSAWGIIDGTGNGHYQWRIEDTEAVRVVDPEGHLEAIEPGIGRLRFEEKSYPTNGLSVPLRVVDPDTITLWFAPLPKRGGNLAGISTKLNTLTKSNPCTWMAASRFPLDARLPKAREWRGSAGSARGSSRWLMVVGRRYYVMATLGSAMLAEDQVIFVTPEMDFFFSKAKSADKAAEGGLSFLPAEEMEHDFAGNVRLVEATRAGFIDLSASFAEASLGVVQNAVQIVDPVQLEKYIIRLPIDIVAGVMHSYRIRARGGTTRYIFSSADSNPVVDVDRHQGSLLVRQQRPTNQSVVVQDMHDETNYAEAFVVVSEPKLLRFQSSEIYVTIGDIFPVQAILQDAEGVSFDNCTGLETSLKWEVHGAAVSRTAETDQATISGIDGSMNASVCSERMYKAGAAGTATITARYGDATRATLRVIVLNKISIESPKPNLALDAKNRPVALIMVHASVDMRVLGGKLVDSEMQVFSMEKDAGAQHGRRQIDISNSDRREEDHIGIHERRVKPGTREFILTCRREGDFEIVLERTATMVLLCRPAAGAAITLMPEMAYDGATCGTGPNGANVVTGVALPLRIDAFDAENRRFTHLQGFKNEWSLPKLSSAAQFETLGGRTSNDPMRNVRVDAGFTGNATVKGVLTFDDGEDSHHLTLEALFALGVYEDLALDPPNVWPIIPDPEVEYRMRVTHGPQHGQLECSATSSNADLVVVSVTGRDVAVRYAAHREPRDADATLLCQLNCLIGAKGLHAPLQFRRVAKVALSGPNKLREGAKATLVMQAFSRDNGPFSAEMHRALLPVLEPIPAGALSLPSALDQAVCAQAGTDPRSCAGEWRVDITAVKAGEVLLRGSTLNGAVSADHKIRIYQGIEITPGPEKAVEPGVKFRLRRRYGPFLDPSECHFEVGSQDASVAEILDEPHGIFYARSQGRAEVCVLCREDGHVIDKACVSVRVMVLSQMEIQPALVHMIEGDEMRLRGIFPEVKEVPIDYGVIPRAYSWSVENATVAAIQGPVSSNEYSVWVSGLRPGKTRITLRSSSRKGHGGLETSVIVIVEQKLRLLTPAQVIMPRHGALEIRTSVDTLIAKTGGILSFFVGGRACHSLAAESSNIIDVDVDGVIRSKERLGEAPVIVEYRSVGSADEDIVQFATVHVLVREIASIGVRQLWPDLIVPLGMPREVHASVFDKQGSLFTAPFNTIKVEAMAVDDDVLAISDVQVPREPVSFHRLSLEGLQTGTSSVYLTIKAPLQEPVREDYVRVVVIPGVDGVRFVLDEVAPRGALRSLLLVPGQPLLVPVQTMHHLNASQLLSCEAQIGGQTLKTSMKVYNDSSAACQILGPADAHDDSQDRIVLTLLVGDQVISSQTVPLRFGFRLVPADGNSASSRQATIGKGYMRWEEEDAVEVFQGAVRMELETALQEEKPILLVHEGDPARTGFADFSAYIDTAPASAKHLFLEMESMPFQSRLYSAKGFYEELISCITNAWSIMSAWRLPLPRAKHLAWPEENAVGPDETVLVAAAHEDLDEVERALQKAPPKTRAHRFHGFLAEAPVGASYIVVLRDMTADSTNEEQMRRLVEAWAVRHHPDVLVVVHGAHEQSDLEALITLHLSSQTSSIGSGDNAAQTSSIPELELPASSEASKTDVKSALPHSALFAEVDSVGFGGVATVIAEANRWKLKHGRCWKLPIARIDPPFMAATMSPESCERARCFVPRPSDIIIATAPKSGTTMLQWICHLLRTDGGRTSGALEYADIYQPSPWIELSYDMGLDPYEAPHFPRNYKSHVRLGSVQPGCKYIVTVRDPARIVISYYNFLSEKGVPEVCSQTLSEFLRSPDIADGQMFGASIWEYYQEYYACRDDPSVLCLVFEDFLTDPKTQIQAIADFMDIGDASEDLVDRVVAASTKEAMKEHASKFDESWASEEIRRLGRARQAVHFEVSSRVVTKTHSDTFEEADLALLREKWDSIIAKPLGFATYEQFAQEIRKSVHARLSRTSS
ncbi:Sulfotransferase 1C3 [Hondaea fermentalgiana]|uniref:Sulfotransferase 1C3 n=1 Tax=Hondaea fermentalgiana TaxID=2315210 RepID=A0A2R5GXQ9_9STRA|nr:Sulfotransferase 1C3 [Hondaea fermentalgiana]|eukprot:GBG32754.1 Sulfotransferase 1C3 [Hondaea fermentalgiana]